MMPIYAALTRVVQLCVLGVTGANRRSVAVAVIVLTPGLAVLLLPILAGWHGVLDKILAAAPEAGASASSAPEILSGISSDLGSLAVATIVGTGTLSVAGDRAWVTTNTIRLAALTAILAICSIYSGIRFRFALVEQITIAPLDLDLIGDRLVTQGLTLLASVSLLLVLAFCRICPSSSHK